MELLTFFSALCLTVLLALIKSFVYLPSALSDFELSRRAEQGDGTAAYEIVRRPLLPALSGLRIVLVVLLTSILAAFLVGIYHIAGVALFACLWLMSDVIAAKGWATKQGFWLQKNSEPRIIKMVERTKKIFSHFAPRSHAHEFAIGSREELLDIISSDQRLLAPEEKNRIQAALKFDKLKISDVMVPRNKIATVKTSETVGPVLLDRLHKAGHNIFIAVKKDLDDIKGLLYMTDATSGHPEIKTVNDAIRPKVHYITQDDPLVAVLAASLQTGRQLFIVVDNNGNTMGLITLGDVLAKLLGNAPPASKDVSTELQKVKENHANTN